jgi:hypothetical protein
LVFTLKDLSQANAAQGVLRALLACDGIYPGWDGVLVNSAFMEPRQGQYTGTELLTYRKALSSLQDDAEVWAMEIDPELNQVWIGLESTEAKARIIQAVGAASVPLAAISLEVPPPALPTPAFAVLRPSPVNTMHTLPVLGVFGFNLEVRYTNHSPETRYPDQCVSLDPFSFYAYFLLHLSKWNGMEWVLIQTPLCAAVLLPPRAVESGQAQTDSVPVTGVRKLQSEPVWRSARITGTYRLEGTVYRSPPLEPPFANLAPLSERVSNYFRIIGQ